MKSRRKSKTLWPAKIAPAAPPEPAGDNPSAPTPPSPPPVHASHGPFNAFLREQTAMNTLRATGIEQGWSPPALLCHGEIVASLPKGPHRLLKSYEIIELLRVHKEWNRPLSATETTQLLGWAEP